jgi:hypothetical protein
MLKSRLKVIWQRRKPLDPFDKLRAGELGVNKPGSAKPQKREILERGFHFLKMSIGRKSK